MIRWKPKSSYPISLLKTLRVSISFITKAKVLMVDGGLCNLPPASSTRSHCFFVVVISLSLASCTSRTGLPGTCRGRLSQPLQFRSACLECSSPWHLLGPLLHPHRPPSPWGFHGLSIYTDLLCLVLCILLFFMFLFSTLECKLQESRIFVYLFTVCLLQCLAHSRDSNT